MAEIAELKAALKDQIEQRENELAALKQAYAVLDGDVVTQRSLMPPPKSKEYDGLGITKATQRLYAELGGETKLTTREIAEELLKRGINTRSKNYVATVYATLDNAQEFKRTKDGKWELVEGK